MFYPGKEFCLGFLDAKLYKEKIEQELENYPENAAFYEDILITVTGKIYVFPFFRDIHVHVDLIQTVTSC